MGSSTKHVFQDAAFAWFEALRHAVKHAPEITVGEAAAKRTDPGYADIVLKRCLQGAFWHKVAVWDSHARTAGSFSEMAT